MSDAGAGDAAAAVEVIALVASAIKPKATPARAVHVARIQLLGRTLTGEEPHTFPPPAQATPSG